MKKQALLMSCALGALVVTSGAARAADASAAANANDNSAASTVSEIIVTAEKRAQNIQSVPVAVTAFTSKDRALEGINTVQDMTNFTPGLTYSSQLDRPAMRGLARNNNIYLTDSAVAVYYDDFYSNSTFLVGRDDMLIDQVEVLLGPQGTLYGRNAIGGLINTLSKRPTDTWSGEMRAIVGNYGYTKIEGTVSGPITDNLSFRLSAYDLNQTRGYLHNLVPGAPSEGDVRHDPYVDAQLQYKTAKDDLWLDVYGLTFNNDRGGPGSLLGVPVAGPYDTASTTPAWLVFNPNFPYGGGAVPGSVVGMIGTNNPALTNIRNFASAFSTDINVRGAYAVTFHATHHFDGVDLKYVGGYSQYRYNLFTHVFENDNSPITQYQFPISPTGLCAIGAFGPCGPLTVFPESRFQYETETKWFSHELTLSSTTQSPLQWIAGAYFYNETDNNPETWNQPNQPQIKAPSSVLALLGGLGPFVPAVPNPSGNYLFLDYQDSINSIAGYGQVDWKVTSTIKLTGGLRYTYDYKSGFEEARFISFSDAFDAFGISPANFGSALPAFDITPLEISTAPAKGVTCAVVFQTSGPYAGDATRCLGDHSDALTGTAGVEWTPNAETLAYLRYNRGYKAFGFNAGLVGANSEALPEHVDDFEVGLKHTFGRRFVLDTDAFYYNYYDDQVPIGVPVGGVNVTEFVNVPKSISDGFEVQATWTPIDNLNLSLVYALDHTSISTPCVVSGAGVTGACYVDALDPTAIAPGARPVGPVLTNGVRTQAINGAELPQAPENKVAFNTTYTLHFQPGNLILSGSFVWKDKSYAEFFTRSYYEAPSWNQVDLRATWSGDNDRYEIVLYVKNLFNTLGYDAAADGYEIAAPVGGGAQTWANSYDLTPPRLYGVEVHYKF